MSSESNDTNSVEEAKTIVKVARDNGVTFRLIGGLAVRFHCHGPHAAHTRAYQDIDLFGLTTQYKKIYAVFEKLGYSPNIRFNTLYGSTRLQFIGLKDKKNVDVFLNKFRMEHTLDLKQRLHLDDLTIPITDLLLTKLQNVQLETRDAKDIIAILEDHEIGRGEGREMLNVDYIAELCSRNWGLYKSVTDNLNTIFKLIEEGTLNALDKKKLKDRLETLQKAIQGKRKTLRWKLRSIIGERVKWYNEVEIGEEEIY